MYFARVVCNSEVTVKTFGEKHNDIIM